MRNALGGYFASQFLAIQRTAVPRSEGFTEVDSEESLRLVNALLSDKPAGIHLKLRFFLVIVDVFALVLAGGRFLKLDPARRKRVLDALYDCKVPLIRKGFWGVNTLAKLGVYGQPRIYPAIGYRQKELPDGRPNS